MLRLSSDDSFHFELLRNLGLARYSGADVGEVLEAAGRIEPGNFDSFYDAFHQLATRVAARAGQIDATRFPVSARDAWFRAATYYRAADFYLHGRPEDPRINELWEKQTAAFDAAIALLPVPGERVTLKADGFEVPAIFYAASADRSARRPTIVAGNGYDGAQEELLHECGFAALERGYNFVTYEGPGQPSVRRYQGLGFVTEWERAVSPVVDYLLTRPEVDASAIGLIGISMGGFLCLRAAAFEHRLAAVISIDGVYNVGAAFTRHFPPEVDALLAAGDTARVDAAGQQILDSGLGPTVMRWGLAQGLWSFKTGLSGFVGRTRAMTLEGIADQIRCPVWVGNATGDIFFSGQPEMVRDALGERATYVELTAEDAAGHHCHVGAGALKNQQIYDWFAGVVAGE